MEKNLQVGLRYTPQQVLPHRHAMLLVDEVDYGPDFGQAALTIRADSMFCDGVHGVPAWVGIEYMAQAMSVYSGVDLLQRGLAVKIGLLIGTRRYESEVPVFAIGTRLTANARLVSWEDNDMYVFACEIRDGTRVLARGDIKAYRPEDIHAFLGMTQQ
jgi:predicted hotdog family 3-hydroxylacyl-ACP dehydratase